MTLYITLIVMVIWPGIITRAGERVQLGRIDFDGRLWHSADVGSEMGVILVQVCLQQAPSVALAPTRMQELADGRRQGAN
jgi:hypothetical protein